MGLSSHTLGAMLLVLALMADTPLAARFIVGGDSHWTFGFNYTDWAIRTAPFHLKDTLVFMYDPPSNTTHPHSVYLMKNLRSYMACDLKKATLVGNVMQGGGDGLEFVLNKRKPYYFACGEKAGFHCTVGQMKFIVPPAMPCHG